MQILSFHFHVLHQIYWTRAEKLRLLGIWVKLCRVIIFAFVCLLRVQHMDYIWDFGV